MTASQDRLAKAGDKGKRRSAAAWLQSAPEVRVSWVGVLQEARSIMVSNCVRVSHFIILQRFFNGWVA